MDEYIYKSQGFKIKLVIENEPITTSSLKNVTLSALYYSPKI